MGITKEPCGTYGDGRQVYLYTLTDEKGQSVTVINVGCVFVDINILDKDGKLRDVNLGYNALEHYMAGRGVMGATIGRVANRIAGGEFTLNGKKYQLEKNEKGVNMLHSGTTGGYQGKYWDGQIDGDQLILAYHSPDGESGFPGNLTAVETVTFKDGKLAMEITATSDADTVVNFTNHAYYNLNGQDSGDVMDHILTINADLYSQVGEDLIPAGDVAVDGTPFDFRTPHAVGERIGSDFPQVRSVGGYDVNYVLRGDAMAARAVGTKSGIVMEVYTNATNMQFFSGIGTGRMADKGKIPYANYAGFCLEPHAQPNAINNPAWADQVILRAGQTKLWRTTMAFSVENKE